METRHRGESPWEEVWFLELTLADGRGLWLRHTLSVGAHAQGGVWATWFSPTPQGWHEAFSVEAFHHDETLATVGGTSLTSTRVVGQAGPLVWDLALADGDLHHQHVPALLTRLGLGRTYESALTDCTAVGELHLHGETIPVRARGVLGHIFGGRNRVNRWAWAHASVFDKPGVVFEGISARIAHRSTPPMTSLVLATPEGIHRFSRMRDLLRTRSIFEGDTWRFRADNDNATLWGEFHLPPTAALAAYTDADGRPLWCRNGVHSRLQLELTHRGRREHFRSARAVGEIATRVRPVGEITLP